jgi:hypothetical protein
MKWDNDKGHTDNLLPVLKALNGGTAKKPVIKNHPEFFNEQGEVTEGGAEFLQRCLALFPFLKKELNV